MRLGLFTAAFPGRSLESIADWAAANGFSALELACWPPAVAERRYAGVTTLDVTGFDRAAASRLRALLEARKLVVS